MKKLLPIVLIVALLFSCFSVTAFADKKPLSNDELSKEYEPGAILVTLNSVSMVDVGIMLKDFEITDIRLVTHFGVPVYYIKFAEETTEAVNKAIEILSENPNIEAKPNYIDEEWPVRREVLAPGRILVSGNVPTELLKDFEIEETRYLTPGSHTQSVYLVVFKEKTIDIVFRALGIIGEYTHVEPDYYSHFDGCRNGDVDDDNKVTIIDASLLQKYLAGIIGKEKLIFVGADYDGDGSVTIADVTKIQRRLAGLDLYPWQINS